MAEWVADQTMMLHVRIYVRVNLRDATHSLWSVGRSVGRMPKEANGSFERVEEKRGCAHNEIRSSDIV